MWGGSSVDKIVSLFKQGVTPDQVAKYTQQEIDELIYKNDMLVNLAQEHVPLTAKKISDIYPNGTELRLLPLVLLESTSLHS